MRSRNKLIFIFCIVIFFSCMENVEKRVDDREQIISLVFDSIAKPTKLVYPPLPLNKVYTHSDSLKIDSIHNIIRFNRKKEKFKVAIYENLRNDYYVKYNSLKFGNNCKNVENRVSKFNLVKEKGLKIDIQSLNEKVTDTVFLVAKSFFDKRRTLFSNTDLILAFSDVAFNQNYTQAILFVNESRGVKGGGVLLYYLEKQKNKWKIVCTKEISIS